MRSFVTTFVALALACAADIALPATGSAGAARAPSSAKETFPTRTLRLIVPYPAGGTVDTIARELTSRGLLGQSVVVDNRPGANGIIGTDIAAKAPPDGHTLLLHSISHATNATLYGSLPYDTINDFVPVTKVIEQPNMLVGHPSVPADSVKGLIALAKAKPGQLSFASPGNGSSPHLSGELFKSMAGIDIVHVPYRGGPQAMADLLAGRVQLSFQSVSFSMPLAKSGKVKALAITSAKRSPAAPDLPTVAETIPGYEAGTWYGLFAPRATPKEIVARLQAEVSSVLHRPQVRDRLTVSGAAIVGDTPEHFASTFKADVAKWRQIIIASGARID